MCNSGHIDEHKVSETTNKAACTPQHTCQGHEKTHKHAAGCGHEAVPHAEHMDYLVDGHLHHPCDTHCDDHGAMSTR